MSGKGSKRRPLARITEEQMEENWRAIFGGRKTGYSERYDAQFDLTSREWLEGACTSPECRFCADRPPLAPEEDRPDANGGARPE